MRACNMRTSEPRRFKLSDSVRKPPRALVERRPRCGAPAKTSQKWRGTCAHQYLKLECLGGKQNPIEDLNWPCQLVGRRSTFGTCEPDLGPIRHRLRLRLFQISRLGPRATSLLGCGVGASRHPLATLRGNPDASEIIVCVRRRTVRTRRKSFANVSTLGPR